MQLLTPEDAAKQLSFKTKAQVYRMVDDGRLPGVKLCPRGLRIPQISVDEFLRNRVESEAKERREKLALLYEALEGEQAAGDRKEAAKVRRKIERLEAQEQSAGRLIELIQNVA